MATEREELQRGGESAAGSNPVIPVPAAARTKTPGLPSQPSTAAAAAPAVSPGRESGYASLVDDYSHFSTLHPGEIRQGKIVKISPEEVIVDIGYKCEGLVPIEQFRDATGQIRVQPGDAIDVMVENALDFDGYVRLSHERARRLKLWDRLEKAFAEQSSITVYVLDRVKGGLEVDVGGARAFLPGSQVELHPVHNLEGWKGKELQVRILKLNRKRGNIVVSRRVALEKELQERRKRTLEMLVEGAVVTGTVKNLTDYGVFVDLGGIDGLLHVTDISYGRVSHPSEVLHVGDQVTVKVLKFDRGRDRVSLGIRQLLPDPWESVAERYPVNCHAFGRVMNVTDYGAFVELEPGVEGLIHVSEMTWSKRTKHPSKIVRSGDQVEVVVLDVQPKERRISLGLKQLEPNPWTTLADRYAVGSVVEGRVRNLTDFGAFVEIEDGVDGLVHVSDISWAKHIKHPSEALRKGQRVQAVILRIDAESRRLSLGIKQLQPDAWELFFQNHGLGDLVRGRVTRRASFGLFVEVAEGVEGLCHNSEIPSYDEARGPAAPADGQEGLFRVIKLNPAEKKIGLSLRDFSEEAEHDRSEESQRGAAATSTIEEVLSFKEREEK
ncbi:MAG: 30S ribosomal protein S1 [Acidobacteria bacterium]|nr:30S ribosomal protein S1 [Acidobacteriota bacterium]